jgi:multiple sugar transport system substrate-binding protein
VIKERSVNKKLIICIAAMAISILMLGGIAIAQDTLPRFDGVNLKVMSHPGGILPIVTLNQDYVKQNLGIDLTILESPDPTSYQDAVKDWRAGGGTYDIVMHFPRFNGELATGYLLPLDDLIAKYNAQDLFDGVVDAYRILYSEWGGHTYTVPVDGDVAMMYYRKDAFENPEYQAKFKEKYGYDLAVPTTWDQTKDIAEFFTGWAWGDTGKPGYGFQSSSWNRSFIEQQWAPMMASAGGNWFDCDLNPAFNGPAGVRAAEDVKKLLEYAPPDSITLSWGETMETVFANDVAMVFWYMDLGRLGGSPDAWFAQSAGPEKMARFGYAMWPGYEVDGVYRNYNSMFYGRVMGISSFSKNPDAAFNYLLTMLRPETRRVFMDTAASGSDMYLKSDYSLDAFQAMPVTQEFLDVAQQVLSNGFPEMELPGAGEYLDALQGELHAYFTGAESDAQAALNRAADRWNEISDRYDREAQKGYWLEVNNRYREAGLNFPACGS